MIPLQRKHYPYIKAFDKLIINRHSEQMHKILLDKGVGYLINYEKKHLGKKMIVVNSTYENFYKLSGFHCLVKKENDFYAGTTVREGEAVMPLWTEIKVYFRMIFGLKNKIIWSTK